MWYFVGGVALLILVWLLVAAAHRVITNIATNITTGIRIGKEGRVETFENAQREVAQSILKGGPLMSLEQVVETAEVMYSQYYLLEGHPEAWASAILGGYMTDLCEQIEMDEDPGEWSQDLLHYQPTIEKLRKKDEVDYLKYLHLDSLGKIPDHYRLSNSPESRD
jgi:hypothetical protein